MGIRTNGGGGAGTAFDGGAITDPLLIPDGTTSLPAVAFASQPATGISGNGSGLNFSFNTSRTLNITTERVLVGEATYFGWAQGAAIVFPDTMMYRDGAAGKVGVRNATNAMTFNVYNTFTDASNYERLSIDWQTTSNVIRIASEAAGTGTQRDIAIMGTVGINETAPGGDLEIRSGGGVVNLLMTNAAGSTRLSVNGESNTPNIVLTQSTAATTTYSGGGVIATSSGLDLTLQPGASTKATLDAATGNLGIGTTAPGGRISVADLTEATGSLNIQVAREVHTLAAAGTSDTTLSLPSGAMLLGASFNVDTAVVDDAGDDTHGK